MRRSLLSRALLSILLCSFVVVLNVDEALAKKGGGGRGTRGPSRSSRPIAQPKHHTGSIKGHSASPLERRGNIDRSTLSQPRIAQPPFAQPPFAQPRTDLQLDKEERKLDHRLQTAQHLRDNSARNGNANLLNTADRMEQRAYQHYDSRLGRLGGGTDEAGLNSRAPGSLLPEGDITAPTRTSPTPLALGDQHNTISVDDFPESDFQSLDSARAVEERKLQHLFDVAQKLRDIAARNGNENLLRTADQVEQVAISRYERKLALWGDQSSEISQSEVMPVSSTIAASP